MTTSPLSIGDASALGFNADRLALIPCPGSFPNFRSSRYATLANRWPQNAPDAASPFEIA